MSSANRLAMQVTALESLTPPKWEQSKTAWLLSFIDLTSILTGFFVLMFSTQTIDRQTWTEVTGSFKAAFAPQIRGVMPVVPDGVNNALVVATGGKSGLGYLDALLQQRMAGDEVWGGMVGKSDGSAQPREMFYAVPMGAQDAGTPAGEAAWKRLAAVVRSWKNPMQVRAVVPARMSAPQQAAMARKAIDAARILGAGDTDVVADIQAGPAATLHFVVGVAP